MNRTKLTVPFLLFKDSFCLFFILIGAAFSKRVLKHYWNKYKVYDIPVNVFNLCVNWLHYTGRKYGMTYETINVIIFCIIWPIITITSLLLNLWLIIN